MKISIIGGGSMGAAVAVLLCRNRHTPFIWTPIEQEVSDVNCARRIDRLPEIEIPSEVTASLDMEYVLENTGLIVIAVPSVFMRQTAKNIQNIINVSGLENVTVVCCSKGIENRTGLLLTEVIEEEITKNPVVVLSGPSYAAEIAMGMPTAVVAASKNADAASFCQDIFMNANFRVYTSEDVIGVELGGALKNIIALCSGISDGLGFGDDTRAALLTRGIAEISRLGEAMGANPKTFFGLTGIGDLILTATGKYSRNKQAGMLIGKGYSLQEALSEVRMVTEGVSAAGPALILADKYNVDMPIIREANAILYQNADPKEAVLRLMGRDKKSEF